MKFKYLKVSIILMLSELFPGQLAGGRTTLALSMPGNGERMEKTGKTVYFSLCQQWLAL